MRTQLANWRGNLTGRDPAGGGVAGAPRRFRPWWLAVVAAFVLLPVIGYALGGSRTESRQRDTDSTSEYAVARPATTGNAAPVPAAIASGGAAAPAQRQAAGSAATTADSTGLGNASASVTNPQTGGDSKIIRNGSIALTVRDVPGTMNAIWNTATDLGGFVVSSSTQGAGDDARAEVTLRVPAEQYNAAMTRLRGYGVKVLNEKSTAQDVSEEYVDLQARQRNLELTVAQFQTLLGQARNVDETLKVQTQLNSVQGDLERVRGRLRFYDNRAAFSTITATLSTPTTTKITTTGWSFADSAAAAWERSLRGLQGFADLLIAVVIGGWWLLLLGIVAFFVGRRALRRRAAMAPAVAIAVAPAPPAPPAAPAAPAAS